MVSLYLTKQSVCLKECNITRSCWDNDITHYYTSFILRIKKIENVSHLFVPPLTPLKVTEMTFKIFQISLSAITTGCSTRSHLVNGPQNQRVCAVLFEEVQGNWCAFFSWVGSYEKLNCCSYYFYYLEIICLLGRGLKSTWRDKLLVWKCPGER